MYLPTLRQLQYFLALADTLSVSKAAELCHMSQSTLSTALGELETLLGAKLFQRDTRSLRLTPLGEDLAPKARHLIESAENFVHLAKQSRTPLGGKLTLGVIPTIAPYLLPKLLPALQKTYKSLDLTLKEDLTGRQLEALKRGAVDVVLMAFPYDAPHIESKILWTEAFFLARKGAERVSPQQINVDDLAKETILLLEDGHCLRDHIISACRLTSQSKERKALGATSLQTLIQMVQHGYGSTLLPAMAIKAEHPPQGICIYKFKSPQPTRQIGIAWRKGDPRAAEFKLLGDFITKTHE